MTPREKFAAAILLFVAWLALVLSGATPAAGLISAIHDALFALGVFAATVTIPPKE
jgi:hypothetical protein